MPLAQPLPALRRQLQEILSEDLPAALTALKELLPEGSEKHNLVLALRARLNDANKERARNTLSSEEYLRRVDTIRANCFDLLSDLEEADFEVNGGTASDKTSAAKHGSVLYHVPHQMPLRKPSICKVRVAIDEDAILEDIVLDDDVRIRNRVEVSDVMQAELLDPEGDVFDIRPLSATKQLVRDTGYTQWVFNVTPRVEGEHQLLVKVSMMEFVEKLNDYVPREVSILETITIVTEAAVSDSDEPPLKATGEHFTLGPDAPGTPSPVRPTRPHRPARPLAFPRGIRTIALFLVFLLIATSTTWALTPQETKDYLKTRYLKDKPEAYDEFLKKHPNSKFRAKALSRKAELTDDVLDYQKYLEENPQGEDAPKAMQAIERLGNKAIEEFQRAPSAQLLLDIATKFPAKLERLSDVLNNMDTSSTLRKEYLPVVKQQIKRRDSLATIEMQPISNPPSSQNQVSEMPEIHALKPEQKPESQAVKPEQPLQQLSESSQLSESLPESTPAEKPTVGKDSDGDGVPDKDDVCPDEKGDAAHKGCIPLKLPPPGKSGLDMMRVEGGSFNMGDDKNTDKNNCEHWVSVKTFEIGKYEVTQADWREVMGSDPVELNNKDCDECPVEGVSWDDVQDFLKKLNAKTGKNYRLPTEAEWEFAARGGLNSKGYTYSGSNDIDNVALYNGNYRVGNTFGTQKATHPVGSKAPNELGIYDMSGNVSEWCQDIYGPYLNCSYPKEASSNRVCRGGSWSEIPIYARVTHRYWYLPRFPYGHIGFRAARD